MSTEQHTRVLSLAERWKRQAYLSQVDLWLDPMPRQRRRQVLRELKANLGAAALEDGMPTAIDELGRPRALARQYLETEPRGRPTWYHGVFAVAAALVVWLLTLTSYVFGSIDTLLATGLSEPAEISFFGLSISTEAHETTIGATFTGFWWPGLIILVVIFLLASRIWRLLPRTPEATADDAIRSA